MCLHDTDKRPGGVVEVEIELIPFRCDAIGGGVGNKVIKTVGW